VLAEMAGATCLMDPVFFDRFEEGAAVSCPARVVYSERIPTPNLLIVSPRHPDHFDLAWLDLISRNCDVICPPDPLFVYGLCRLGFDRIHPVELMGEISSEGFELYPTRSEAPVWYRFDFGGGGFSLSERNGFHPADIVHRIAASALAGWIERRKSFFYMRAYSGR